MGIGSSYKTVFVYGTHFLWVLGPTYVELTLLHDNHVI